MQLQRGTASDLDRHTLVHRAICEHMWHLFVVMFPHTTGTRWSQSVGAMTLIGCSAEQISAREA